MLAVKKHPLCRAQSMFEKKIIFLLSVNYGGGHGLILNPTSRYGFDDSVMGYY